MQELHIILSCTARKRGSELGYPRLRSVDLAPLSDRVEQWVNLVAAASPRHVAADLYAGEYWQVGMELASRAALAGQSSVSIVSAGLGLVGAQDEVPMYGTTLAAGHPDSVLTVLESAGRAQVRRQWWKELTGTQVLDQCPSNPPPGHIEQPNNPQTRGERHNRSEAKNLIPHDRKQIRDRSQPADTRPVRTLERVVQDTDHPYRQTTWEIGFPVSKTMRTPRT